MATAQALRLVVVTPERTQLDETVESLRFPLYDGEIGILPGRLPLIGRLGVGELVATLPGGQTTRLFIDGGFVQVNWAVNLELVSALVEGARERGIASFVELYAGAGNFTLPLLRAGLTGVAIEHAGASIRAARRAARAQGMSDDAFVAGDAPRELERRAKQKPDLVLLDPPRTGAREAVKPLLALGPRFIAFCACDPVTLARDVKMLAAAYALDSVTAFDMFPHTHHVETLLWLRRRGA